MSPHPRIAWGLVLALALVAHAAQKWLAGVSVQEMLWACHLATAVLAVGLLANLQRAVFAGFVFHVGIGLPAYVIEIATNGTTPTSVVAHALPLLAGALALRGVRPDWVEGAWAWALFMAAQVAALFTDRALNVNVVWAPHSADGWIRSVALLRVRNAALAAACLGVAMVVVRWALPRLGSTNAR